MSSVNVQDLCIRLGQTDIIKSLSLDVQAGEFVVLLGPSGCGKSTLLHGIAGLMDTQAGTVHIGGQDMTNAEPSERGIGMVFQSYALYPTMTVERNLSFGLSLSGTAPDEVKRRVKQTAQMLQLQPLLQRKPAQLSGGQRQRVAIGRALVRQAQVFLLDEPLSNLDAQLRTELRREIKLLHQSLGNTMIYVTHDQVEAMTLATRIVVMRGGKIQQVGAPTDVYERPDNLFVAGFLGNPGMNFVEGSLHTSHTGLQFSCADLGLALQSNCTRSAPREGQAVKLGVRPEHIRIHAAGAHPATVQLVEPMGNHQVVWLQSGQATGALSLAAVVHDALDVQMGQPVHFDIDCARVSLFDSSSEVRL